MSGFLARTKDHRSDEVRVRAEPWRLWLAAISYVTWIPLSWIMMLAIKADSPLMPVFAPLLMIVVWVMAVITGVITLRLHPKRLMPRRLAAAECGACAYRIADLPREADGCTVCPECGAAWKLDEGARARSHEGAARERKSSKRG